MFVSSAYGVSPTSTVFRSVSAAFWDGCLINGSGGIMFSPYLPYPKPFSYFFAFPRTHFRRVRSLCEQMIKPYTLRLTPYRRPPNYCPPHFHTQSSFPSLLSPFPSPWRTFRHHLLAIDLSTPLAHCLYQRPFLREKDSRYIVFSSPIAFFSGLLSNK